MRALPTTAELIKGYQPVRSQRVLGRKPGRPSLYDPRYCDEVIVHMEQGYSLASFSDYILVNRDTIHEWTRVHPDFSDAVARGKAARLKFWEKLGIEVAQTGGNGSQATMVIFGLKNMGSDEWRDKQEVTHSGQLSLTSLVEASMKTIEGRIIEPDQNPNLETSDKPNDLFG
jgi:hypothetical protein